MSAAARIAALLATTCAACARPPRAPEVEVAEVRGLWVVRHTLAHRDSVRAMVRRAAAAGFNTLIVQVRGRGDAYYRGRWEPPPPALAGNRRYDPLALTIREARRRGLRVHAWVNTHLVANADTLPLDSAHFVYRRPDLLAVPRALARELYPADPRDPRYLEALRAYARDNRDHVEGLYASPAAPEVKEHLYSIWMDLLERYRLDGLHFDYVRYPGPDYDYSRVALERFRDWLAPHLPDSVRGRLAQLEAADPLVYTDSFPGAWDRFRRLQITELVERVYHAVKKRRPGVLVSAAVFADAADAEARRFQEWREWLRRGWLDVACPMAYTDSLPLFRERIQSALEAAGGGARVWAGIGAYRNTVDGTASQVAVARELGAAGVVLFSYDFMARQPGPAPETSYLRAVSRQAFPAPQEPPNR
ncbi:MAG TPA: family 10 glycosylhydrolase [Gemmatimonadales bacterium]|nr:family 10 glycosylhydrolase [Gemmatimonadales bacterium]